jgi:hypothetical protein
MAPSPAPSSSYSDRFGTSRERTPADRRRTALHEAGHAVAHVVLGDTVELQSASTGRRAHPPAERNLNTMSILSKPAPTIPDWRADPRVRRLDERAAEIAVEAEQADVAREAAIVARGVAQAAHATAEAAWLRGEANARPAEPVDDVPAAQHRVDELAREIARLAELRPAVEAQAKADARAAVIGIYRPAVRKLATALEAARAANMAVVDLWLAAEHAGLAVPPFAFLPLLRPDDLARAGHPAGRELAGWQRSATQLLVSPPKGA